MESKDINSSQDEIKMTNSQSHSFHIPRVRITSSCLQQEQPKRKATIPCFNLPNCRWGDSCGFLHPPVEKIVVKPNLVQRTKTSCVGEEPKPDTRNWEKLSESMQSRENARSTSGELEEYENLQLEEFTGGKTNVSQELVSTSRKNSDSQSLAVGIVNRNIVKEGATKFLGTQHVETIQNYLKFLSYKYGIQQPSKTFTRFVHRTLVMSLMSMSKDDDENDQSIEAVFRSQIRWAIATKPDIQYKIAFMFKYSLSMYPILVNSENWENEEDFEQFLYILSILDDVVKIYEKK